MTSIQIYFADYNFTFSVSLPLLIFFSVFFSLLFCSTLPWIRPLPSPRPYLSPAQPTQLFPHPEYVTSSIANHFTYIQATLPPPLSPKLMSNYANLNTVTLPSSMITYSPNCPFLQEKDSFSRVAAYPNLELTYGTLIMIFLSTKPPKGTPSSMIDRLKPRPQIQPTRLNYCSLTKRLLFCRYPLSSLTSRILSPIAMSSNCTTLTLSLFD